MVNVSVNLIMFKVRQQYGLRRFAKLGLAVYLLAMITHAVVVRLGMASLFEHSAGVQV